MGSEKIAINRKGNIDFTGLMTKAQAGDPTAYRQLLQEVARHLRSSNGYLENDQHDVAVESALQNILLTLHTLRHTYDPAQPFEPWLMDIARDRARHFRAATEAQNCDAHPTVDVGNDRPSDRLLRSEPNPVTPRASNSTALKIRDVVTKRTIGSIRAHLNKFSINLTKKFVETRGRLASGSEPDRTKATRSSASAESMHDMHLEYGPAPARRHSHPFSGVSGVAAGIQLMRMLKMPRDEH